MQEITITKKQAAQRLIDAGILMFFRNDDPVAIHTVAMAGFQILRDLVKNKRLENTIDSVIRPGKEEEFWTRFKSFSNFCKHADRDPNDISSSFLEDVNDVVLLIGTIYYGSLGCQWTKEMQVLRVWYRAFHPDVFSGTVDPSEITLLLPLTGGTLALPRREQLAIGLTALKMCCERE